jgi:hypothetical protein
MICSRRMFLVSCSFSVRCAENSARSQVLIRPPKSLKPRSAPSLSMPAATRRCAHPMAYSVDIRWRTQPLGSVGLRLPAQPEVQSGGSRQAWYAAPVCCLERRIYERTSRHAP